MGFTGWDSTMFKQGWRWLCGGGGLLVILCFFLPFIGPFPSLSAMNLANLGFVGFSSLPIFWLIIAGGVFALLNALLPTVPQRMAGGFALVTIVVVVAPLVKFYLDIRDASSGFEAIAPTWQIGFWGILLGAALIGAGAILAFFGREEPYYASPAPSAPVPPPGQPMGVMGGGMYDFPPPATPLPPMSSAYPPTPPVSGPPSRPSSPAINPRTGAPLPPTEIVGSPQAMRAWLVSMEDQAKQYGLEQVTVMGRDGRRAKIILNDPRVSSEHACIRYENRQYVLHDLASTNGTYWNGRKVGSPCPLADGDRIRVGQSEFIFKEVR